MPLLKLLTSDSQTTFNSNIRFCFQLCHFHPATPKNNIRRETTSFAKAVMSLTFKVHYVADLTMPRYTGNKRIARKYGNTLKDLKVYIQTKFL